MDKNMKHPNEQEENLEYLYYEDFLKNAATVKQKEKPDRRKPTDKLLSPYVTNKLIRTQIDRELKALATLETSIGIDSTKEELEAIETLKKTHENKIKEIDLQSYMSLFHPEQPNK